jgi:hypothetical protein
LALELVVGPFPDAVLVGAGSAEREDFGFGVEPDDTPDAWAGPRKAANQSKTTNGDE